MKRFSLHLAIVLCLAECVSAWKLEGRANTVVRCPSCLGPVDVCATEIRTAARSKEVVTYYQCLNVFCGTVEGATNWYVLRNSP